MKSKTLDRLDLIRASQEVRLLEQIALQNNQLEQLAHQQAILSTYQEKLARDWREGETRDAATMRRAAAFHAASRLAAEQIAHVHSETSARLRGSQDDLAQSKVYARKLADARAAALRVEERAAEARRERQDAPIRSRHHT